MAKECQSFVLTRKEATMIEFSSVFCHAISKPHENKMSI
jgi:hypothetical protein